LGGGGAVVEDRKARRRLGDGIALALEFQLLGGLLPLQLAALAASK
jgi:hypothetical protein